MAARLRRDRVGVDGREAAAAQVTREQGRLEGRSEGEEEDTKGELRFFFFPFPVFYPLEAEALE